MIVVDVGAMLQGPEESVHKLIDRFQPELLYAFDPHPAFVEGVDRIDDTVVVSRRAAAWTKDGYVGLLVDGICTGVDHAGVPVRCFDLAAWLWTLPFAGGGVVLKLDAEGAEYPLLHEVGLSSVDAYLDRVIVEWHPPETAHGFYGDRPVLRCPVEEWA